ncbi:mitochondrial ribosomal protein subunit L38 [Hyaloraphidium curvatum]|nr:mitochondrial ribosomal protein subunit L38 [Hyaloraphidium curvatum]
MLILKSIVNCIDNSGARACEVINVLKGRRWASAGDEVVVVVKKARTGVQATVAAGAPGSTKVKKGEVSRAVIVRTAAPVRRKDGSIIRFDDNACVLIDKKGQPIGNRVLGVVAQEVRTKGWGKITALAPKVI